jgi:hypothetical protein
MDGRIDYTAKSNPPVLANVTYVLKRTDPINGSPVSMANPAAPLTDQSEINPCTHCGHEPTVVMCTPYVLYVRCATCWETWSVPKPGVPPLDGTLA